MRLPVIGPQGSQPMINEPTTPTMGNCDGWPAVGRDHSERVGVISIAEGCALKAQCTTGNMRRLKRWEHEAVLDAMQDRLDRNPKAMQIRKQTVEHPFGTIKSWMGSTHFLTKTLPNVRTEMSLHVLAYNLKRMIQILGVGPLIQAIQA